MRDLSRVFLVILPVFLLAFPAAAGPSPDTTLDGSSTHPADSVTIASTPPDCPYSWAVARIKCKHESRGAAVGVYGGAEVSLFCDGEKAEQAICVAGFSYAVRMSSENGTAVDCFFRGNGVLNEACGDVQLTIN